MLELCELLGDTLPVSILLQLVELPRIEHLHGTLDGPNCVEQAAVHGPSVLAANHGRLGGDEALLLQRRNIFANRVGAHLYRFPDGFVAGVALVGFPVLDREQVAVDGDFTGLQTEMINLIGNREVVFDWIAFGPSVEVQIASPLFVLLHSLVDFVTIFFTLLFLAIDFIFSIWYNERSIAEKKFQ